MNKYIDNMVGKHAVVEDVALGTRSCSVCGKKILKGEKHLSMYGWFGSYKRRKYNFCHNCSYYLLMAERIRLTNIEMEMFSRKE